MTFKIYYPSGRSFELAGTFLMLMTKNDDVGHVPGIDTGNEVVLLDPRGVIVSPDEALCESYFPEKNLGLAKWAKDWLAEHPDWPTRVKF